MKLKDRVAIVTGASRGIGRAVAEALSSEGAAVVVGFHEGIDSAQGVVQLINARGGLATAVRVDVAVRDEVTKLLAATLDGFGRVDVLVNNAGMTLGADLFDISDQAWDRVLEVNLKGTFLCCQIIGRQMLQQGFGRIVNIASTAGLSPFPSSHHYVASKAGVIGLTRALALSLAPHVTVNSVAPGFVETETRSALGGTRRQALLARIPLGRLATVVEVANTVRFLVCEGEYITGQTIVTDGGLTLSH